MIIFFSGNGNSKHVAESLATQLNDTNIVAINKQLLNHPELPVSADDKRIVWVVPVHAWGLPAIVCQFMSSIVVSDTSLPHYLVVTCGDDAGYIEREWRHYLDKSGLTSKGCWHVIMPNTYITLPGFDVDNEQITSRKLREAQPRIVHIAKAIAEGSDEIDIYRGGAPHLKSYVFRPVFRKCCMSVKPFHATDKCISCGVCVRSCPLENIILDDSGKPQWGNDCTFCLACYNRCPQHAVEYGKYTAKKGQYYYSDRS